MFFWVVDSEWVCEISSWIGVKLGFCYGIRDLFLRGFGWRVGDRSGSTRSFSSSWIGERGDKGGEFVVETYGLKGDMTEFLSEDMVLLLVLIKVSWSTCSPAIIPSLLILLPKRTWLSSSNLTFFCILILFLQRGHFFFLSNASLSKHYEQNLWVQASTTSLWSPWAFISFRQIGHSLSLALFCSFMSCFFVGSGV